MIDASEEGPIVLRIMSMPQEQPQRVKVHYVKILADNVSTAISDREALPVMSNLIKEIFFDLERLGWMRREDCLILSADWIDFAYVHFDHSRQEKVRKILEILNHYHVYPIGRYGLWDYISMEDTILTSIETARTLVE